MYVYDSICLILPNFNMEPPTEVPANCPNLSPGVVEPAQDDPLVDYDILKEPLLDVMLTIDKPGTLAKQKLAMKHFNYFLTKHYDGDITEITSHDELTVDLFGKYTTYLAEKATVHRKTGGELVSYLTCQGYLSATKMYFQKKFMNEKLPPVFEQDKWRFFTSAVKTIKSKQARQSNKVSDAVPRVDMCTIMTLLEMNNVDVIDDVDEKTNKRRKMN